MKLISTVEVGAGGGSISFTNIPQTYTDLRLVISSAERNVSGQNFVAMYLRFNSDTGNNYSAKWIYGNGSGTNSSSSSSANALFIGSDTAALSTANTFSSTSVYIPNYSTSEYKSASSESVAENNASFGEHLVIGGFWNSTAAITSIQVLPTISFDQYTTASLYGVTRTQAIGKPKAVGGTVSFANGYWYHTFTGSGTFSANQDLTCDALVIAAGGSGGGYGGGGGGAGGFLARSSVITTVGAYPVVIGAGGASQTADRAGFSGAGSSFNGIAATGGGAGGGAGGATRGYPATTGGSGGGAGMNYVGTGLVAGAAGISGQGNAGSDSYYTSDSPRRTGGGGGAGAAAVSDGNSPNGGAGLTWVNGSYYAGGGGGGHQGTDRSGPGGGAGGTGGGGAGATTSAHGIAGTANTGGGGGGGNNYNGYYMSGAGGSGLVIIRYLAD